MKKSLIVSCFLVCFINSYAQSLLRSGRTFTSLVPTDTLSMATRLGRKLDQIDTMKLVRVAGNQTVGGIKTFGDIQLTKSIKWLNPQQNIDWDFITVDSAVFYSGVPYRNFAIRVKAPVGPGYKQFTFNPNGDFYASGTVYPTGGIYVATGDIYTGRNLTVVGDATVSGRISVQNGTSTQALMADGSLKKYSLYDDVVTVNGVATTLQGVGLRTSTPSALFEINSTGYGANNALKLTSSNDVVINVNTTGSNWIGSTYNRNGVEKWFIGMPNLNDNLLINGGGNVGIGNGTPVNKFEVLGNIRASGSVISNTTTLTSDRRLKSNVVALHNATDILLKLQPREYDKKESFSEDAPVSHEYGFIAQEVQKILPSLVTEGKDKDKILSLNYMAIIPFLVKSLQEKDQEIKDIKKELSELREMLRKK